MKRLKRSLISLVTVFIFLAFTSQVFAGGVFYYVNANAPDQGAASYRSVKTLVDSIGATKQATMVLSHSSAGDTTVYQLSTDETITSNIGLEIHNGAVLNTDLSIRNATYKWTASGSGVSEYYLELAAGGDPGISTPSHCAENDSALTEAVAGALAVSEWDWADNDVLGYSTVYVRLSDSTDPDGKAVDYVEAGYALTISGPLDAGLYQVFSGNGSVAFGNQKIAAFYPQWWYDGEGDWKDALNTCFAYSNRHFILTKGTYEITGIVNYGSADSSLDCYGAIKAKASSDFGSAAIFGVNASNVILSGLHVDGNSANVTDNGLTGNQPNIMIYSGVSHVSFFNTTVKNSMYCGINFDGLSEHVSFDNMKLENIGEHGFYISGGSNKHLLFRNIEIVDFAQNATMGADHDTHVFKVRSTINSTNKNIVIENVEVSIPSGTGITVTAVLLAEDLDECRVKNITGADLTGVALLTTDNAKNIEFNNIDVPATLFYNISTGDPNIEGIVVRNCHFAEIQNKINVCTLVEACTFDKGILTESQSANIDPNHSTTFTNCIFKGDTLTIEKFDLDYGLEYPLIFRDVIVSGDCTGSVAIIEVAEHYAGTGGIIKFYNCDFSGCTNTSRITKVYGTNAIDEMSFIDCNIGSDDLFGNSGNELLTIINTTTGALTTVANWGSYNFRNLKGSKSSEGSGTATIANGNTSISVTVNTLIKPIASEIVVTPIESLGAASFFYIVVDAAGFDIHVNADPTQDVDFSWKVKIKQ